MAKIVIMMGGRGLTVLTHKLMTSLETALSAQLARRSRQFCPSATGCHTSIETFTESCVDIKALTRVLSATQLKKYKTLLHNKLELEEHFLRYM